MKKTMAILLGGALGTLIRHYILVSTLSFLAWPSAYKVLFINLTGALLAGILYAITDVLTLAMPLKLFLLTGFLGAFTVRFTWKCCRKNTLNGLQSMQKQMVT